MKIQFATPTSTYRCDRCRRWYRVQVPAVSCTVLHHPGQCCHYGEIEVEK